MNAADMCPRAQTTDAAHCWHALNAHFTTDPPQQIHRCCRCGSQKGVPIFASTIRTPDPSHGPFQP